MTTPLETAVRELVAALPKCGLCGKVGTRTKRGYNGAWCTEHGDAPLLYEAPLLCVLALLAAPGPAPVTEVPGEIAEANDPATEAFDRIAEMCGCPEWDYPGQIVRDVQRLKRERDDALAALPPHGPTEAERAVIDAAMACDAAGYTSVELRNACDVLRRERGT